MVSLFVVYARNVPNGAFCASFRPLDKLLLPVLELKCKPQYKDGRLRIVKGVKAASPEESKFLALRLNFLKLIYARFVGVRPLVGLRLHFRRYYENSRRAR